MINIISNGSKWFGESPDPLEKLMEVLHKHPLDRPMFRDRFVFDQALTKTKRFHGGFQGISHVFNIETDETGIIEQLTTAIKANVARPDYLSQIDLVNLSWLADDQAEVEKWRKEFQAHHKNIQINGLRPETTGQVSVWINMPRNVAKTLYNYSDADLEENDIGVPVQF